LTISPWAAESLLFLSIAYILPGCFLFASIPPSLERCVRLINLWLVTSMEQGKSRALSAS
ncbi:hypothetical protein CF103_21340, partial [Aeromonas salmonicida]